MTRVIVAVAIALVQAACAQPPGTALDIADLVIADVTIVSPERPAPLEHAFVAIRNGRIDQVASDPLEASRTIDGRGRFLIPGLIDSHVHLGQLPMLPEHQATHPGMTTAALAQEPRSYLYYGFTTVIDLGNTADAVARWHQQNVRPDAWFCGAAPIANGYPMVFATEDVRFSLMPYFLYDERQRDRLPPGIDPASHTPERVAARMRADGAICAKTYYETGFGAQRGLPTPEPGTITRLVAASQAAGIPTLIHANSLDAQRAAVEGGAHAIAHGLWNGNAGTDGRLNSDAIRVLDAIADRGIGYQPTMQVLRGEFDLLDEAFLADARLRDVFPTAFIAWAGSTEGQWFRREIARNVGDVDLAAVSEPLFARLDEAVGRLATRGARLLFGSDTPSGPTYANPPGLNGWWEIQRWVDAGVTKTQIFQALTLANARAFHLEHEVGSVTPGRRAHLLLLRENPLVDAAAYDSIDAVILGGVLIPRSELSARGR